MSSARLLPDGVVAIDIVRVPPSRLNTLASQAAQTLISPASQVSRSQNRKTGVYLKRIIWGLPRSAQNPNPATPGGESYRLWRLKNSSLHLNSQNLGTQNV